MPARTMTVPLVASLLVLLPILGGCRPSSHRGGSRSSKAPEPAPGDANRLPGDPATLLAQLGSRDGRPGWGGAYLGMTPDRVAVSTGRAIRPDDPIEGVCGGIATAVDLLGRTVVLGFQSETGELHTLHLPFETGYPREELLRGIRHRLPDLRYQPGRHHPEWGEAEDPNPQYVMGEGRARYVLLVKPEKGIWISRAGCMD